MIRGRSVSYAVELGTSPEVTTHVQSDNPLQVLFVIGSHELNKGNYAAAIQVFKILSKKTASPRVKLELARSFYLDQQYQSSKQLFEEVQSDPRTPYTVKENIQFYLDEIDQILGTIEFGLSIVTDSNPRNFTNSHHIKIAGQTLTVIPPADNREVVGIRYNLDATKALIENGLLTSYLGVSYSDYPNSSFDLLNTDVGAILSFKKIRVLRLRLGLEESFYAGDHLYELPYLGFMLFPRPLYQYQINGEFKIGKFRVLDAHYLDAINMTLTTRLTKKLGRNVLVMSDFYLEDSIAEEDAYSYYGGSIGVSLDLPLFKVWRLKPYVSIGRRLYEEDDPFFDKARQDTRIMTGLIVKLDNLSVYGLTPSLGFTYEETISNIDYFSYDKIGFVFDLQL